MICDRCERDWDGRPYVTANIFTGVVQAVCEKCAIEVIDEEIAARKLAKKKASMN